MNNLKAALLVQLRELPARHPDTAHTQKLLGERLAQLAQARECLSFLKASSDAMSGSLVVLPSVVHD